MIDLAIEKMRKWFWIGQDTDLAAMTGCSVIIAPSGAVGGVDVRGGSPNTRDTDALKPENNRKFVHAVMLSGGSAFGLAAGDGAADFLETKKIGRDMGIAYIPNVSGASLFDLFCGSAAVRPNAASGFRAAQNAFSNQKFLSGNFGAGTGATVGNINGEERAMKGGIGQAVLNAGELMVGAVVAVNAIGDVFDEQSGHLIAGARDEKNQRLINSEAFFLKHYQALPGRFAGNTVIGCVMTNAHLNKAQANKLAAIAHNGIARSIRPAHTTFDGDTLFALAAGEVAATFEAVAILSVEAVRQAVLDGIKSAESYQNFISFHEFQQKNKGNLSDIF